MYSSRRCKNLTCTGLQTISSDVSIGLKTKLCGNLSLPFAMVPCLHQSNVYIHRKLRVWSAQKCIPLVGAKSSLTCAGLQTTPSFAEIRVYLIPMVPCLHKSIDYIKRKLREWRVRKCIHLVGAKPSLTCTGLQTTTSHVSQYRAENGNLRKSESTYCHGTVFPPKQCLYQKEATGRESPKMCSSCRCINLTYLCGTVNDPVSSRPVEGRERKFAEIRLYL